MVAQSEFLYNIKSTIVDFHHDPTGATQEVQIAGTYTNLLEAKAAAKLALTSLGYDRDCFQEYEVRSATEPWPYPDGVLVHARAPTGEEFTVEIETIPNTLSIVDPVSGAKNVGQGLYYVVQSKINYALDRSGANRSSIIEGVYASEADAIEAARSMLLDDDVKKEDFAEYDEFAGQDDWPFGENVVIHAIGNSGENYTLAVLRGK